MLYSYQQYKNYVKTDTLKEIRMKTKKILLIGKTGQLGEQLLKITPAFGFKIIGLDRQDIDVTDTSKLQNVVGKYKSNILINATAYNLVTSAESEPENAMKVNYEAVANMAGICNRKAIKFVTFSTDYVFDGKKGEPHDEHDATTPLQVYGRSTLLGASAALHYHPGGALVIRTCGVYGGEKGSSGKGNFVLNILKEAKDKETIEVSCEQVVNPTYAGDLAGATIMLLQKNAEPGIYHLASEGYCSWYEFAKEILKLAGVKKEVKPVDRGGLGGGVMRPKFSALANTKGKALGVVLPTWQEGLVSYFKDILNIKNQIPK